jgi:hypothetical protein
LRAVGPQQPRGDDEGQHCATGQAGPRLLQAEHEELDQRTGEAVCRQAVEQQMRGVDALRWA